MLTETVLRAAFFFFFFKLNVFPLFLDGLSRVEAFVNFASAVTWKWPFVVCPRDKAVFFGSLEKNTSLATTCIMLNQPGESQLSLSLANIDMEEGEGRGYLERSTAKIACGHFGPVHIIFLGRQIWLEKKKQQKGGRNYDSNVSSSSY